MATDIKRYIQVYTGDGKGKTTAALGLSIRAAGHGLKTYIGQFMKGQHYGELTALRDNPFITIEQYGDIECIHRNQVTQKHKDQAEQGLIKARDAILSGKYDMVILDEINVTIWFGLLTVKQVLKLLDQRPQSVEIILTGRYAPQEFIEYADLVSEMKEVKHYYKNQGILARDGIER
jgi:cob(I)alamin adenosyltransferase